LRLRVNPWLVFVYTLPFLAIGFLMTTNGQLAFTRVFNRPGAVNPVVDFVLSKISAPFAEEFFIRGTAIPFVEALTFKILPQEKLAEAIGFLAGNTIASIITAIAHTVAFSQGGVVSFDTLALEFGFSFGQGCLSKVFGALPSISLHVGRNFAF
jgi:membrane protease YdiL (CAAX protease family)